VVAARLNDVRQRVAAAAARAGRDPAEVTLVAVSKTVGPSEITEAYGAGHRDFGENRSGELAAKAAVLPGDINWHFVGSLQSRKAKEIAPYASMIHSVDRESLLRAWARTDGTAELLLQLNLAQEVQKHGADAAAASEILDAAASLGLKISGLMLMPPQVEYPEDNRVWFRRLYEIRRQLQPEWPDLRELSMGMTDDFEVAVEEGATLIRVGRAIFES
jgi:pyridoxal phosphate enzyme (YggS family)